MKKRVIVICLVCIAVICCAIYLLKDISKTPSDIVRQYFLNESASFNLSTVIEQIDIDSKTTLIFYRTANGGVANAVLERGLLGYKIVDYSGEVALTNDIIPSSCLFSSYGEAKSIMWYVLYDQSITRVIVGGNEASIFSADNLKIYYTLSDSPEAQRCEFYNCDELIWLIE